MLVSARVGGRRVTHPADPGHTRVREPCTATDIVRSSTTGRRLSREVSAICRKVRATARTVGRDREEVSMSKTVGGQRSPRVHDRTDERGITTAEYAVGTAAGAGFAGLLYKLLTGGFGDALLKTLFDHVLGLLGIK